VIWTLQLIDGSLGPPKSTFQMASCAFAGLTVVTDRQTDHTTPSVVIGRI